RALRRQQPIEQRLQAIGLLDDHLRVFHQLGALELALEQLRRAAQASERVLDFVREIANQLARRDLLVEQALFALHAQLLRDRSQLDEERRFAVIHARENASKRQRIASLGLVDRVLRRVIPARRYRLSQGSLELRRFGEEHRKALPGERACTDFEQVLGSRV